MRQDRAEAVSRLRTVRVGIVEKNRHSFWDGENAGWRDAGARLGLEVSVLAPVQENLDEQRAMMRRHLDDGVDVLGFVGIYPDAFDDIVAEATSCGVPCVCFDLDAPRSGRKLYVGMNDPYAMGRWAGEKVLALLPSGPCTIGVLTGSEKACGAVGKMNGFVDVMEGNGHVIVGGANDFEDVALCRKNCQELLDEHPDVDVLYGVYSYHTAIQGECVKGRRQAKKPIIFGWDVLPETIDLLQEGVVDMAVWIKEYYFGYYAAAAATNLARIGVDEALEVMGMDPVNLEGNTICPEAQAITPDTVGEYIEWRRSHGLEERLTRLTC